MKRRAFTLSEVLLASALLLVVTGLTLSILTDTYRRSILLDTKQDALQRFIVARNTLSRRLLNVNVQLSRTLPDRLVFLTAATVSTAYGNLNQVSSTEMTNWITDQPRELSVENRGGRRFLVEKAFGRSDPQSLRVLWPMGEVGELQVDTRQMPMLQITLTTQDSEHRPWSGSFTVRVENYG